MELLVGVLKNVVTSFLFMSLSLSVREFVRVVFASRVCIPNFTTPCRRWRVTNGWILRARAHSCMQSCSPRFWLGECPPTIGLRRFSYVLALPRLGPAAWEKAPPCSACRPGPRRLVRPREPRGRVLCPPGAGACPCAGRTHAPGGGRVSCEN
jgi:hypothetical protein